MFMVDENDPDAQCFIKAKRKGMRTFTLIERDPTAADTIAYWLTRNKQLSDEKKTRTVEIIKHFQNAPNQRPAD